MKPDRVVYIHSPELTRISDLIPHHKSRSHLTHSLIHAYSLDKHLITVAPEKITLDDILEYHDDEYIDALISGTESSEFGLEYDCAPLPEMEEYTLQIASASLTAAKHLNSCDVAINWEGGRHHAFKAQASGFCYINDVVLTLQSLMQSYKKILYIDFDIHHPNAVQDAFYFTNKVTTLSTHLFEPGYYPQTGSIDEIGSHKGEYHSINLPFKRGLKGIVFKDIVGKILDSIMKTGFDCIVVQCGVDTLPNDPLGGFNLSIKAISEMIEYILSFKTKTLILGIFYLLLRWWWL